MLLARLHNQDQLLFEQTSIGEANLINQLIMKKNTETDFFILWRQIKAQRWISQYLSCAQMASLSLMVLKRRRIIGKGTLHAFWRILCLRVGKEVALMPSSQTAFFKAVQKSMIGLGKATQGGLGSFGINMICCCRKVRVSFAMLVLARSICP